MKVDLLFIGAHPDDVEWGLGGSLLLLRKQELSFAIVDLTRGEMGSRGTAEERRQEAIDAAEFLGAAARENLDLPDCGLVDTPENRRLIATAIRRFQPNFVVAPYWEDRHPDHAAAGALVRNTELYATLRKIDDGYAPHKPEGFLYYLLHHVRAPSLVVDITGVFDRKMELLRLHRSQFSKTAEEFGVLPLGMPDYLFGLESRDRFFGSLVGVKFGEALVTDRPIRFAGLGALLDAAGA